MTAESLHFSVNVRTTAYKGISLSLKRNVIVMITTRIQIESYLAEYIRGKYYDFVRYLCDYLRSYGETAG